MAGLETRAGFSPELSEQAYTAEMRGKEMERLNEEYSRLVKHMSPADAVEALTDRQAVPTELLAEVPEQVN